MGGPRESLRRELQEPALSGTYCFDEVGLNNYPKDIVQPGIRIREHVLMIVPAREIMKTSRVQGMLCSSGICT